MTWQDRYLKTYYRDKPGWVDGTKQYFDMIRRLVPSTSDILELGAGPTNPCTEFLASNFHSVDGLDVDPDARQNKHLRTAHIFDGDAWPIANASYDAVISNYVLEHIPNVDRMAAEALRVLKPGGQFIFRTPNLWHYVSMVSRCTPQWFHELVANRLRKLPAEAHAPYPTYYRANTRRAIRRVLKRSGFEEIELVTIEKNPSYGMSSRVLFFTFMAYERIVNSTDLLSGFRVNLLGSFRKPIEN